jgi:hypothetical protein
MPLCFWSKYYQPCGTATSKLLWSDWWSANTNEKACLKIELCCCIKVANFVSSMNHNSHSVADNPMHEESHIRVCQEWVARVIYSYRKRWWSDYGNGTKLTRKTHCSFPIYVLLLWLQCCNDSEPICLLDSTCRRTIRRISTEHYKGLYCICQSC